MKTILWAAITANGNYMHGDSDYRWKKEVFEDFDACALDAGNCIIGRKTYEEYAGSGGSLGALKVVVVSRSASNIAGVTCAGSPSEALSLLEANGYTSALVGGGDSLLNAFLAEGLADELILNITPELGGSGNRLSLPGAHIKLLKLVEMREIGEGIARMRYAVEP